MQRFRQAQRRNCVCKSSISISRELMQSTHALVSSCSRQLMHASALAFVSSCSQLTQSAHAVVISFSHLMQLSAHAVISCSCQLMQSSRARRFGNIAECIPECKPDYSGISQHAFQNDRPAYSGIFRNDLPAYSGIARKDLPMALERTSRPLVFFPGSRACRCSLLRFGNDEANRHKSTKQHPNPCDLTRSSTLPNSSEPSPQVKC